MDPRQEGSAAGEPQRFGSGEVNRCGFPPGAGSRAQVLARPAWINNTHEGRGLLARVTDVEDADPTPDAGSRARPPPLDADERRVPLSDGTSHSFCGLSCLGGA
jgi:hypothetical protein